MSRPPSVHFPALPVRRPLTEYPSSSSRPPPARPKPRPACDASPPSPSSGGRLCPMDRPRPHPSRPTLHPSIPPSPGPSPARPPAPSSLQLQRRHGGNKQARRLPPNPHPPNPRQHLTPSLSSSPFHTSPRPDPIPPSVFPAVPTLIYTSSLRPRPSSPPSVLMSVPPQNSLLPFPALPSPGPPPIQEPS
ncbi:hypothetical protein K488DRAFT_89278 [Vararia minispora EC-137]|uniref:Uncharacterized protein n=1 Tax=Vararia minispora EC-137 TaxID=1314806 RepID=A0ACB8QBD7_9AGAM|nr:hypothetical protein K488DRAFT_89278 [Vararia minispora EC-137]